jgi:hypothetical protein
MDPENLAPPVIDLQAEIFGAEKRSVATVDASGLPRWMQVGAGVAH